MPTVVSNEPNGLNDVYSDWTGSALECVEERWSFSQNCTICSIISDMTERLEIV